MIIIEQVDKLGSPLCTSSATVFQSYFLAGLLEDPYSADMHKDFFYLVFQTEAVPSIPYQQVLYKIFYIFIEFIIEN